MTLLDIAVHVELNFGQMCIIKGFETNEANKAIVMNELVCSGHRPNCMKVQVFRVNGLCCLFLTNTCLSMAQMTKQS
eukprot:m.11071 g.11071  ORF g.11071 m.11071 type:complete len:77 (-) comp5664_c0_seq1:579-809(-)